MKPNPFIHFQMGGNTGHELLHLILSSRTWGKLKTSTPVNLVSSYHIHVYSNVYNDKLLLALNECAKWKMGTSVAKFS